MTVAAPGDATTPSAPAREPLNALLVEDSERDAELIQRELKRGGYGLRCERVETADTLRAALRGDRWDVVLSDWTMPNFDALGALVIVKELAPDLPFIIVSGTVGEETAVSAMRGGANDFITKQNMSRLLPAITRELADAVLRMEHKKLQEQLFISDRMASVGTLAAGVAHEINNPLAVILANIQLALLDLKQMHDETPRQVDVSAEWEGLDRPRGRLAQLLGQTLEALDDAREAADRVRDIVRDLKIFSRPEADPVPCPVDVRRALDGSLRMAQNEVRHRARIVKDYAEVPPVRGNEGRLAQVCLNLIVNAAQAIPEGRTDENEIRMRVALAPGSRVLVEIRDTGAGIAPDLLPRVFDAFFTTKSVGVGTGLGLSICHRLVTLMDGEISIASDIGKGTTVRLLLPVATEPVEERPALDSVIAAASRRGRILVVDDEPMIRTAVRRMLAPKHDVATVEDARGALTLLTAAEQFDVILCDLMMPNMTGMDLHAELLIVAPELASRVVFVTGGAFTPAAREFLDRVPNPRLEKPFDMQKVHSVIEGMVR